MVTLLYRVVQQCPLAGRTCQQASCPLWDLDWHLWMSCVVFPPVSPTVKNMWPMFTAQHPFPLCWLLIATVSVNIWMQLCVTHIHIFRYILFVRVYFEFERERKKLRKKEWIHAENRFHYTSCCVWLCIWQINLMDWFFLSLSNQINLDTYFEYIWIFDCVYSLRTGYESVVNIFKNIDINLWIFLFYLDRGKKLDKPGKTQLESCTSPWRHLKLDLAYWAGPGDTFCDVNPQPLIYMK